MDYKKITELIFEGAYVSRIERTGWVVLGDNREHLGEHVFMTSVIAYFLARELKANLELVLTMSLFHDFHESRTGELDKINLEYVTRDQAKANTDIFSQVDPTLLRQLEEYEQKESLEARIVYEANIIALLVQLKLLEEKGNTNAKEWLEANVLRIRIPEARKLADMLVTTNSQIWWQDLREKLHQSFSK